MVYYHDTGMVYLFGGERYTDGTYFSDTWKWDGSVWTELFPFIILDRELFVEVLLFPDTGGILYGGSNVNGDYGEDYPAWMVSIDHEPVLGDTWLWNGTDWTDLGIVPSETVFTPGNRCDPGMTGTSVGGAWLFGGWDGTNILGDLWNLTPDPWTWVEWAATSPWPAPRTCTELIWDELDGIIWMFGGFAGWDGGLGIISGHLGGVRRILGTCQLGWRNRRRL